MTLFKKIRQIYWEAYLSDTTKKVEEILPKFPYALVKADVFGKILTEPVTREEVEESLTKVVDFYRNARKKCTRLGLNVSEYDDRIAKSSSKLNYVPIRN
jgi:hypothetical protein